MVYLHLCLGRKPTGKNLDSPAHPVRASDGAGILLLLAIYRSCTLLVYNLKCVLHLAMADSPSRPFHWPGGIPAEVKPHPTGDFTPEEVDEEVKGWLLFVTV
jgi:hypothetical protein